jgi:hypothetical protein
MSHRRIKHCTAVPNLEELLATSLQSVPLISTDISVEARSEERAQIGDLR